MNLQICFMNDTASDTESPSSDSETCPKLTKITNSNTNNTGGLHRVNSSTNGHPFKSRPLTVTKPVVNSFGVNSKARPSSLALGPPVQDHTEVDFFTQQAKLQIEARMALSQAKDMAHMQMEVSPLNLESAFVHLLISHRLYRSRSNVRKFHRLQRLFGTH